MCVFFVFFFDDLLPLDVSVMLGQHSITKLLLSSGAKDSSKCKWEWHVTQFSG